MVREDLDASRVVQLEGCPTGVAVPLVTPDGSVAYVQYPGANRMLSAQHCADLPESDVLLVQGEIPSRTSERAATVIRRRGGVVVVHPEPAEGMTRPLLDLATVVVADERHALRLRRHLGDEEGAHDIEALAAALCERDVPVVVGDDHGRLAWCASDDAGVAEPPTVTVADVTAGSDAGCAAVGIALAEGASLAEACAFAAAAWAATTSREGAEPALPTRQEVADLRAS
jgi:ribokinase